MDCGDSCGDCPSGYFCSDTRCVVDQGTGTGGTGGTGADTCKSNSDCGASAVCAEVSGVLTCLALCSASCSTCCVSTKSGESVCAPSTAYCSTGGSGGSTGGCPAGAQTTSFQSCVEAFYDPDMYNWLGFRNNCSVAVHIQWCAKNDPTNCFAHDVSASGHASTGLDQEEVASYGGFDWAVCGKGYKAVTPSGAYWSAGSDYCCVPL